jgi:hypothetical protein
VSPAARWLSQTVIAPPVDSRESLTVTVPPVSGLGTSVPPPGGTTTVVSGANVLPLALVTAEHTEQLELEGWSTHRGPSIPVRGYPFRTTRRGRTMMSRDSSRPTTTRCPKR